MTNQDPHWFLLILLTAFLTAVMTQAMPHFLRGLRCVIRKSNYYRKVILARKLVRIKTRREVLANTRWLPMWLLRSTMFRWFKRDSNNMWQYMTRVHEHHRKDNVRSEAQDILWNLTTVEHLTKGMVYDFASDPYVLNQHVLSIEIEGDRAKIVTEGYHDTRGRLQANTTSYPHKGKRVRVCLGWCRQMLGCRYCAIMRN